jgi:hypothetical protein
LPAEFPGASTCPDCGGHGWLMEPGPDRATPNQVGCERCNATGCIGAEKRESWPCGCVKGETPHGAGWRDCPGASEREILIRTLRAVYDNAYGWHAGENGKARALNVIAAWTGEALAGRLHPSVELITEADRG